MYNVEMLEKDEINIIDHENKYSVRCKMIDEKKSICWRCAHYFKDAHFCILSQSYYSFIDYWFNEEIEECDHFTEISD